ncbi:MAG: MBOAT family protein [Bacteroidetes bacterium]|jgi:alginate O-acetyltransferase complex protein AlgI|nr:MBOAT family protein [Bacteroidota bacterium]MBT6685271.1 MBOAT family protein [Bacteroidota bacterium]MBT7141718.1 MBOAT family protein [Bacteroidota bacterium]MBT7491416.1 MBOAT family protein [Bacteroidota bacterium]
MLFNSIEFAIFLPIVFVLYWFVTNKNLKLQNILLLVASYVFYGWWDWRFLSLVFVSSLVDYIIGINIEKTEKKLNRKILLFASLFVNLGFLGFFKYYNFFVDSFIDAFSFFGMQFQARTLNIVLPVGISFYTFQTLSYTLDIYKHRLKPTEDIIAFFSFVSFFPQLVAGPIERASNLLPQFTKKRKFDLLQAKDGMRQILWGLFKKIVIADNAATFVNEIFEKSDTMPGSTLFIAAILFAFQIYGDFSGYSDIAIGTARLFGFKLMRNFAFPYFSKDMAEFWRTWHISLSTWLRDYLFLPTAYWTMNKIKNPKFLSIKAEVWGYVVGISFTWFLGGLWHGAKWTFVLWGCLHGLYLVVSHITKKFRKKTLRKLKIKKKNPVLVFIQTIGTFFLVTIAWVLFRAENVGQAFSIFNTILSESFFETPNLKGKVLLSGIFIIFLVVFEYIQRKKEHALEIQKWNLIFRWSFYFFVLFIGVFFGNFNEVEFIYFQF